MVEGSSPSRPTIKTRGYIFRCSLFVFLAHLTVVLAQSEFTFIASALTNPETILMQDYIRAHMWMNIAAGNGEKDGGNNRDIVAKKNDSYSNFRSTKNGTRVRKEEL